VERVAFLVEHTGVRLGCLLNPESLIVRRTAGVRHRQVGGGPLTAVAMTDDPLVYTGGGVTELQLDLLFDVTLAGSSIRTTDVRSLTAPLWDLTENQPGDDGYARVALVRFVWGKSWNIPGVVAAVAERLEFFTPGGAPRRSWLRMRLLRTQMSTADLSATRGSPMPMPAALDSQMPASPAIEERVVEVVGGIDERAPESGAPAPRLDALAHRYLGHPSWWRLIALVNGVVDPLRVSARVLRIPGAATTEEPR
jgi:Contractile injection system tube protein